MGKGKKVKVTGATFKTKDVRKKMNLGIDSFAVVMGVTRKTVEAWEAGTSTPARPTRNLLLLGFEYPELVKETMSRVMIVKVK